MGKTINVLMIGEGLQRQGGIVSVQKLILKELGAQINFTHLATLENGSTVQKIKTFLKALAQLIGILSSQKIDIVHTHVSEGGSAFRQAITTLIAVVFKKPVIMHTHGSEFHLFYHSLPALMRRGMSWILGRCVYVIVLSESWKTFYVNEVNLAFEKVIVLPNAVTIPSQLPDRSHRSQVLFVFFGRIGQRKGAFDLVHAFANLAPDLQHQAKLLLAGDGQVEEIRHLVQELGLTSHITVLDWITPEQREEFSQQADVFVLPSYNEGLPMALLEAMSWGLPVITTPVGGIPEVVQSGENGILVEPGNIVQITDAMATLVQDRDYRLRLSKMSRDRVLPFDIKHYCSILLNIYHSVCSNV